MYKNILVQLDCFISLIANYAFYVNALLTFSSCPFTFLCSYKIKVMSTYTYF